MGGGPPTGQALQFLIKSMLFRCDCFGWTSLWKCFSLLIKIGLSFTVLKAINEDSPTVPALLTDYILKGMMFNILINSWLGTPVLIYIANLYIFLLQFYVLPNAIHLRT